MPSLCWRFPAPIPHFNCGDCATVTLRGRTWTLLPLVEESNAVPRPTCRPWRRAGPMLGFARISKSGGFCYWSEVGASDDYGEDVPENYDDTRLSTMGMTYKEMERRRKIGLANKGKVPWNVGRRHSDATRERIKQKTIEALRNPKVKSSKSYLKVRKKMSEHPRTLSAYTKAKISSSQRRLWRERWKQTQLAENFFKSWANKIAWVAKIGWKDGGSLEWDSYEKMKEKINIQHLRWREEKERAKNMTKIRAQRAAEVRLQKMTMLAQKRKDREEKEKRKQEHRKPSSRQLKVKSHGDAVAEGINLKKRLMRIHRKRTTTIQIACQGNTNTVAEIPSWEDLDLEHIRREKARRELSLADQIQAARSRTKVPYSEALVVPSSIY